MDKWDKLRTLIQWLEQGRVLELSNGDRFAISEKGDVIHLINEDSGVELPYLKSYWGLIKKIPNDELFLMASEVALTKMKSKPLARAKNYNTP